MRGLRTMLALAAATTLSLALPVEAGYGNCGHRGACSPSTTPTSIRSASPSLTASPSPTSTATSAPTSSWVEVVDDEFDAGLPAHWSVYDGPYGSAPHNCAVPSHVTVANGYLNLRMAYEPTGKCGPAWYTGGLQITHALGGIDQRVTLRWRVTGTDLADVRSHRNIPMRWVSDPAFAWYQGEADDCEGSVLTGCATNLHYADPGQISHPYLVDVTQWHTWQFTERANRVTTAIDGAPAWDYQGDLITIPDAFRVAVLQQECQSVCPSSAYAGQTETIEIDWLTIEDPA